MKKVRKTRVVNDAALTSALLIKETPIFSTLRGFDVQMWVMAILVTFIYYR